MTLGVCGCDSKGLRPRLPAAASVLCLVLIAAAGIAAAQTGDTGSTRSEEGEITLDIDTSRFLATYREGTWVPVDIIVSNNASDISGFVEVTTRNGLGVQSPIYRVPAESPKGSRKRFRLYCQLSQADRIEAMLYHKGRRVIEFPMYVDLRPIESRDMVCILLDEEPGDYGFLRTAVNTLADNTGVYRNDFHTTELGALPECLACYEPMDFILMGKTDPAKIPLHQRELIRKYVLEGGVLVICTGDNALAYRGTWIEELAGVRVGETSIVDERDLATRVFGPDAAPAARAGEQAVLARLTPTDDEVCVQGREPVLATVREVGSGRVVVFAVDAAGRALMRNPQYLALWSDICTMRRERGQLNHAAVSAYVSQAIPRVSGIRIFPRSSVFIYLLLYFLIGIVANWIVWSYLKRREMAWVCLVIISIAFTAYAVVYGTAGRAKATELEQIEIVRVSQGGRVARMHSFVGVLTARTARYAISLPHEHALISGGRDPVSTRGMYQPVRFRGRTTSPFVFLQENPPRAVDFTVGASEMRLIEIDADVSLPGGVESTLAFSDDGLHGTLTNNLGARFRKVFLMFQGKRIPLVGTRTAWEIHVTPDELLRMQNAFAVEDGRTMYQMMRGYGTMTLEEMKEPMLYALFAQSDLEAGQPLSLSGAVLCGWLGEASFGGVSLGEPAEKRISEALVVADVDVAYTKTPPRPARLDVLVDNKPQVGAGPLLGWYRWGDTAENVFLDSPVPVQFTIPPHVLKSEPIEVVVRLYWNSDYPNCFLEFLPQGEV
ncbi:MAG: hypothetical protein JXR94_18590, partial [Candidatus Hydrogenedentes bacterium]|nr:hypothetical protein [Candidatus Hydrogenedentota bacterium]